MIRHDNKSGLIERFADPPKATRELPAEGTFGHFVYYARLERELGVRAFAELCGINTRQLDAMERNQYGRYSVLNASRVCLALGYNLIITSEKRA